MSLQQKVIQTIEIHMQEIEKHLDSSFDKINNFINQIFIFDSPFPKSTNIKSDLQSLKVNQFNFMGQSEFISNIANEVKPLIQSKNKDQVQIKSIQEQKNSLQVIQQSQIQQNNQINYIQAVGCNQQIKIYDFNKGHQNDAIVLLGKVGSGKTALYNKITLSQEKVMAGGDSATLNVFMKKSCFGKGFSVLDTPGYGSQSKKINNMGGVLCALSEGPINRIVITIKFYRTYISIDDVKTILSAFMNYRDMITVIVTYWDDCEKAEEETNKKDIQQRLAKFKINSVMFVGKNTTSEDICSQIDQIIAQSQAQNVTLTNDDIYQNFDLTEYDEGEVYEIYEIDFLKADLIQYYQKFSSQAIQLIRDPNIPKGLQPDNFYAITEFAKSLVDETMRKFEYQNLRIIDQLGQQAQLKAFQIHFQLKSTLFNEYEQIVDAANQLLRNRYNFYNNIKKCYYCGQIWFKVAGCDEHTICGNLIDYHLDDFIEMEDPPQQFIVTYKNDILKINPAKPDQKQTFVQEKDIKNENLQSKVTIKKVNLCNKTCKVGGIGCQNTINWSKMQSLKEEEMNKILGILDEKLCYDIQQLKYNQTQKYQKAYKEKLQKKIEKQRKNIHRAA